MRTIKHRRISKEGLATITLDQLRKGRLVFAHRRQTEHQIFLNSGWGQFAHAPRFHMVAEAILPANGVGNVKFVCGREGAFGRGARGLRRRVVPVTATIIEAESDKICPDCQIAESGFKLDLTRPDHAYFFGFAQADGSLRADTRSRGSFGIELSVVGLGLLEAFRDLILPFPSYISFRERMTNFGILSKTATWRVHHRSFRAALTTAGLPIGKKSHLVAPPSPPFSANDYFRGLFDADGSVGMTAQGLPFVSLVTSSDAIADAYKDYVFQIAGKRPGTTRNKRDSIYNIMVLIETAQEVAAALYDNAGLALYRKRESARQVAAWVRPASMRRVQQHAWRPDEDAVVMSNSQPRAAQLLRLTLYSVANRRHQLLAAGVPLARGPQPPIP